MFYPTFYRELAYITAMEKLAMSEEDTVRDEAQTLLASSCNNLFNALQKEASVSSKSIPAVVMSLRETHKSTGEKVASAPEQTAELLQKLATAVYVDGVLCDQLNKTAQEPDNSTRMVQLLGREYAVNLIRGLFA